MPIIQAESLLSVLYMLAAALVGVSVRRTCVLVLLLNLIVHGVSLLLERPRRAVVSFALIQHFRTD